MPQNKKIKTKEELLILGSPIDELCRKELLGEKIKELEKISDVTDNVTFAQILHSDGA